jgi:hypothetical protein
MCNVLIHYLVDYSRTVYFPLIQKFTRKYTKTVSASR